MEKISNAPPQKRVFAFTRTLTVVSTTTSVTTLTRTRYFMSATQLELNLLLLQQMALHQISNAVIPVDTIAVYKPPQRRKQESLLYN
ncbi:hypothetical protein OS493_018916 [Desmophyllum pertusum]|uniref:Uncharacterized protein n=1 Tax=Desmophyllum pertusum TaxID=174260 RepID=A0A9W9Z2D4_9CNID|nr:hypothetical protein OS493_018916 [Desmophyllum pertusum]